MKFKNKNGSLLKSTLPDEVMEKIVDRTEELLIQKDIFYIRNGSVITVETENYSELLTAQFNANLQLFAEGVITEKMLKQDWIDNFSDKN